MSFALSAASPVSLNTQLGRANLQRELESLVADVPTQAALADSFAAHLERFTLRHDLAGAVRAAQAGAAIAVLRRETNERISRLTWLLNAAAA